MRAVLYSARLAGGFAGQVLAADDTHFMIDTTGDLARLCASAPEHPNHSRAVQMCQGYLLGIHHFHTALAAEVETAIYCVEQVEPRPSRDQVMAAFAAWALETPGVAEKEALDGVLEWAALTYPCE
ncbi:MAG: Rap1a/Tai family immunity protein [Pikeienuella sp.]